MFFLVNLATLTVFPILNPGLFNCANPAVRAGTSLRAGDLSLTALQSGDFPIAQLAGLNALFNALLLVDIALNIRLHPLRGGGIRIARLSVVFFASNITTDAVLCVVDSSRFGGREIAVSQCPGLQAIDLRLFALKPGGFASVERT